MSRVKLKYSVKKNSWMNRRKNFSDRRELIKMSWNKITLPNLNTILWELSHKDKSVSEKLKVFWKAKQEMKHYYGDITEMCLAVNGLHWATSIYSVNCSVIKKPSSLLQSGDIVPFDIWLPQAHVEAPVAGSVFLAGVLLRLGAYGFIRFSLPLFSISFLLFSLATFTVFLLSLEGILPLPGFFGKWLVFSSAIHSQFYLLAIFGVRSSIISAFYFFLYTLVDSVFIPSSVKLFINLLTLLATTGVIFSAAYSFFHSTVLINLLSPLF